MERPLVCLHGSFGQGSDWQRFVEAAGRARAFTPDLPAHGSRPHERAASLEAIADELARDLPEACDVVGYSLGGRLALALAHAHPSRVRSLVIESANPGLDEPARSLRRTLDGTRADELVANPRAFLESFWQLPLFETFREHPRFVSEVEQRIERAERDPEALGASFRELSVGRQADYFERAADFDVPLLFVAGERDPKYRAIGARFAERVRGASLVVVPGAGHNVHFEAPERFRELVTAFWEGLK